MTPKVYIALEQLIDIDMARTYEAFKLLGLDIDANDKGKALKTYILEYKQGEINFHKFCYSIEILHAKRFDDEVIAAALNAAFLVTESTPNLLKQIKQLQEIYQIDFCFIANINAQSFKWIQTQLKPHNLDLDFFRERNISCLLHKWGGDLYQHALFDHKNNTTIPKYIILQEPSKPMLKKSRSLIDILSDKPSEQAAYDIRKDAHDKMVKFYKTKGVKCIVLPQGEEKLDLKRLISEQMSLVEKTSVEAKLVRFSSYHSPSSPRGVSEPIEAIKQSNKRNTL